MANRLSYSKMRTYSECGEKYRLQNVEKLREKIRPGALCFGTAIDKTIEIMLKDFKQGKKLDKPILDYLKLFDEIWERQEINGQIVLLHDTDLVEYSYSDFDPDVIDSKDRDFMYARANSLMLPEARALSAVEIYEEMKNKKKQSEHRKMERNEILYFNYCSWLSLCQKGHLMLKAFEEQVMPRIKQVIEVQPKISLKNEDGDELVGYADLVAVWETGEEILFDVKTSSIEYASDSVKFSPQLTIYGHAMGKNTAGYIVLGKKMERVAKRVCSDCGYVPPNNRHKTCPKEIDSRQIRCGGAWKETVTLKVPVSVIIDEIPARTEDIVLDNVEMMNKAINAGIFIRNFNACIGTFGKCAYFDLCYKNDASKLMKEPS